MVAFIGKWILKITSIVLFFEIIQILLPTGSYKKYVSLIVGMVITIIVIAPLIQLLGGQNVLGNIGLQINDINAKQYKTQNKYSISQAQKAQITYIYKQKIKDYVINKILMDFDVAIKDVDVDINSDYNSNNYGYINHISISIADTNTQHKNTDDIYINKIEIVSDKRVAQQLQLEHAEQIEKIKKNISNALQIDVGRVSVIYTM